MTSTRAGATLGIRAPAFALSVSKQTATSCPARGAARPGISERRCSHSAGVLDPRALQRAAPRRSCSCPRALRRARTRAGRPGKRLPEQRGHAHCWVGSTDSRHAAPLPTKLQPQKRWAIPRTAHRRKRNSGRSRDGKRRAPSFASLERPRPDADRGPWSASGWAEAGSSRRAAALAGGVTSATSGGLISPESGGYARSGDPATQEDVAANPLAEQFGETLLDKIRDVPEQHPDGHA